MAEVITYIDTLGNRHTLTDDARFLGGDGLDGWAVESVIDAMPGDIDNFAGYAVVWRDVKLSFAIEATSYDNARGTLAAWRRVFLRDVSRYASTQTLGTVEVVTNGGTYTIEAVNGSPAVDGPTGNYAAITLAFKTPSAFWTYGAEQSAAGTWTAGTVNVAWDNTGDYHAWPTHKLVGAWGSARLTNAVTGDHLEIGTVTADPADEVWVWTAPPNIRYYAGGTAAGDPDSGDNWTGYGGTAGRFFSLDVGAGTVQLTAASGTVTHTMTYDIRKGGLG